MHILGIESSCDETAAAILRDDREVLANTINSQIAIHTLYGGVVPELASRQHLQNIYPVVQEALQQAGLALEQIDLLAVTEGPGLVGCLLVGHTFARTLAVARAIPLVGVDHLAGHLSSVFLGSQPPEFPFVAMLASGGHTSLFLASAHTEYKLLGRSRDDAAGEAFDKVAKLLGLGYPGGPMISHRAEQGNPAAVKFPRAWLDKESLDFSFSGLKTAVATLVNPLSPAELAPRINDICAAFQEAVVEVIVGKTMQAALATGCHRVVLAGGVAANPRLRAQLAAAGEKKGLEIYLTPKEYCTDNAAMIALAGYYRFRAGAGPTADSDVYSRSRFS
ncbi:MAG: tRNA (adenosine(37)-N6)-threonylcarbamoyltransferase complex transferase subunit TsaD [Desulfobulbaceae bacterium]|nr:tRNA (adenosine(37)-N6)-threonylcarbamoyltransferase complex transferase subunit TsaD [Desulfobulbaceae bacterium]